MNLSENILKDNFAYQEHVIQRHIRKLMGLRKI